MNQQANLVRIDSPGQLALMLAAHIDTTAQLQELIGGHAIDIFQILDRRIGGQPLAQVLEAIHHHDIAEDYTPVAQSLGIEEHEVRELLRQTRLLAVWAYFRSSMLRETFTQQKQFDSVWQALHTSPEEFRSLWKSWRFADIEFVVATATSLAPTGGERLN